MVDCGTMWPRDGLPTIELCDDWYGTEDCDGKAGGNVKEEGGGGQVDGDAAGGSGQEPAAGDDGAEPDEGASVLLLVDILTNGGLLLSEVVASGCTVVGAGCRGTPNMGCGCWNGTCPTKPSACCMGNCCCFTSTPDRLACKPDGGSLASEPLWFALSAHPSWAGSKVVSTFAVGSARPLTLSGAASCKTGISRSSSRAVPRKGRVLARQEPPIEETRNSPVKGREDGVVGKPTGKS